jgi:histidine triad (HIT) family protein
LSGGGEGTLIEPSDFVYEDDLVVGLINSFFVGNNSGHIIVVPKDHYENIYTLPDSAGHRVFEVSKKLALVMKEVYGCDGITIRQNNEPAGDQHAFHYHLHVFPRYDEDGYNEILPKDKRLADASERAEYAKRLKASLDMSA